MKYRYLFGLGIFIVAMVVIFNAFSLPSKTNTKDDFAYLLSDNNITVEGADTELTYEELKGLVDGMVDLDEIIKKDEKLLSTKDNKIITACELLEIYYYSMTKSDRVEFIMNASGQKVDISSKGGAMLISYNPN